MHIIPELVPSLVLAVPFLVSVAALHFILFKPLLQYIDERNHTSSSARAEAEKLNDSADQRLAELEAQLAGARKDAAALRQQARVEAQEVEAGITGEARQKAGEQVAAAVVSIVDARAEASKTLTAAATGLSAEIAGQVLGRELTH